VAKTSKQQVWAKAGSNYQVSSKSINQKWVNGREHPTEWQTDNQQTDTSTDNKGRLELSGARGAITRPTFRCHHAKHICRNAKSISEAGVICKSERHHNTIHMDDARYHCVSSYSV